MCSFYEVLKIDLVYGTRKGKIMLCLRAFVDGCCFLFPKFWSFGLQATCCGGSIAIAGSLGSHEEPEETDYRTKRFNSRHLKLFCAQVAPLESWYCLFRALQHFLIFETNGRATAQECEQKRC